MIVLTPDELHGFAPELRALCAEGRILVHENGVLPLSPAGITDRAALLERLLHMQGWCFVDAAHLSA